MSPNKRFLLSIEADGSIVTVYDDEHAELLQQGHAVTRRASHVEPTTTGQWSADMSPVGGPVLGPYNLRSQALEAETDYLSKLLIGGNLTWKESQP